MRGKRRKKSGAETADEANDVFKQVMQAKKFIRKTQFFFFFAKTTATTQRSNQSNENQNETHFHKK